MQLFGFVELLFRLRSDFFVFFEKFQVFRKTVFAFDGVVCVLLDLVDFLLCAEFAADAFGECVWVAVVVL